MENLWFIPAESVLGWPVCKHKYIPGMAGPALTVIWRVTRYNRHQPSSIILHPNTGGQEMSGNRVDLC